MSFFGDIWTRLVAGIQGEAQQVETVLTRTEQVVIAQGGLFFKQVETTLGTDGVAALKSLLAQEVAALAVGGDLGDVISSVADTTLAKVSADLLADARNAVYGVIAILLPDALAQKAA